MSENKQTATLSFSKDKYGDYCLQIRERTIINYTINENGIYQRICCNLDDDSFEVLEKEPGEEIWHGSNKENIIDMDIIDLNERGVRWEGTSRNGQPFGMGCIFDENNNLIYKGYCIKDKKVCWGECFYSDTQTLEYVGNFFDNSHHGYGIMYDKKGNVIFDGYWINDVADYEKSIQIDPSINSTKQIHSLVEEVKISSNSLNNEEFIAFNAFPFLQYLEINDSCCKNAKLFSISNCDKLSKITIRSWCFTKSYVQCKIMKCLSLSYIQIGYHSFYRCKLVDFESKIDSNYKQ